MKFNIKEKDKYSNFRKLGYISISRPFISMVFITILSAVVYSFLVDPIFLSSFELPVRTALHIFAFFSIVFLTINNLAVPLAGAHRYFSTLNKFGPRTAQSLLKYAEMNYTGRFNVESVAAFYCENEKFLKLESMKNPKSW